jgi:hypothetical protein
MRLAPGAVAIVAIQLFLDGDAELARDLMVVSAAMAVFLLGPMLPVYTRSRGLAYRAVKWVALLGVSFFAMGAMKEQAWLLAFVTLWPLAQTEWIRTSIRRKLPLARWPKQLYL